MAFAKGQKFKQLIECQMKYLYVDNRLHVNKTEQENFNPFLIAKLSSLEPIHLILIQGQAQSVSSIFAREANGRHACWSLR